MTAAKWSKADDAKLAELFRKGTRNHGISTKDLSAKYIHKVIKDHFPDREFKNFSVLFRRKARAWNLNQTLQGQRRKCAAMVPATLSLFCVTNVHFDCVRR
jgi:hypothetical protein